MARLRIQFKKLHAEYALQLWSVSVNRAESYTRTDTRVHGRYMSVITVMNTADLVKMTIRPFCS
jgi:hypothetical protein